MRSGRDARGRRPAGAAVLAGVLAALGGAGPAGATRHVLVTVQANGVGGVSHLLDPSGVALSPDQAHLYVGTDIDNDIGIFARDALTGGATFLGHVLAGSFKVAVSPDGAHLYAVNRGSVIMSFARDAGSGALTQVQLMSPVSATTNVTVSPDGAHVYTCGGPRVVGYSRDAGTGLLTAVQTVEEGQGGVTGLDRAEDVTVSPDGAHVYVASQDANAVVVFSRDAGTGLLTYVETQVDGVGGVDGLAQARGVAVSPDGAQVYVGGEGGAAVFTRDAGTGALTFVEFEDTTGGLALANAVAVSPDGTHVYVGMSKFTGPRVDVAIYERDAGTGTLTLEETLDGTPRWGFPLDVAVSADSQHVYLAGAGGLVALRRVAVACSAAALGGCLAPVASQKALLVIKDDATDAKDKVVWKWLAGAAVTGAAVGAPATQADDYALCVYDGPGGGALVAELLVPALGGCGKAAQGGTGACWKAVGTTGGVRYRRKDREPDGVVAAKVLVGAAGSAKALVKAKGAQVPGPGLPLGGPVTVQLQRAGGPCWTATYSAPLVNEPGQYKARAD